MSVVDRPHNPGRAFEDQAPRVLLDLRAACAEVISALPEPLSKATQLAEFLQIDRSLAWKVWRVAVGDDTFPSPKHVPGRSGFRTFLDAAVARGVSESLIEQADRAFARFGSLTRNHAGDRASADILLAQLTSEGRARLELEHRRAAFRANGHFLGVQARLLYQADLVIPPAQTDHVPTVVRLRGLFDLRRLREHTSWVLSRSTVVGPQGRVGSYVRTPIEPDAARSGPPLLPEFCSRPIPPVHRRVLPEYRCIDVLEPGGVGNAAAVDIVTGEIISGVARTSQDRDAVTAHVLTPCERLWYEVYLHRDVCDGREPDLDVYSTIHSDVPYAELGGSDLMHVPEKLMNPGPADAAPPISEVPHHRAMVARAMHNAGIDPASLVLYRFTMRFPPVPLCAAVTFRLASSTATIDHGQPAAKSPR